MRAGLVGPVPAHLRDAHYAGAARLGHGQRLRYPHDYPEGVVRPSSTRRTSLVGPAEYYGRRRRGDRLAWFGRARTERQYRADR